MSLTPSFIFLFPLPHIFLTTLSHSLSSSMTSFFSRLREPHFSSHPFLSIAPFPCSHVLFFFHSPSLLFFLSFSPSPSSPLLSLPLSHSLYPLSLLISTSLNFSLSLFTSFSYAFSPYLPIHLFFLHLLILLPSRLQPERAEAKGRCFQTFYIIRS